MSAYIVDRNHNGMDELKFRAAAALDLSHEIGERGPKTFMARNKLANFLDNTKTCDRKTVICLCKHLERVINEKAPACQNKL